MTDIVSYLAVAPPLLPREFEQGYQLGSVEQEDGTTTWWLDEFDGAPRQISEREALTLALREPVTIDPNKENDMPENQERGTGNKIDDAVVEREGILQKYMMPTISFFSTKKPDANPTAGQIDAEGQRWTDLARHATFTGFRGRVCLDTEDGSFYKPDTDQIVFIALPINHPLFKKGHCEVVGVLYHPTETYVDRKTGELRASNFDPTGWMGIVSQFGTYSAAKDELTELQQAVRAAANSTRGDATDRSEDVKDVLPDDQKVAAGTDLSDWGL